MRVVQRGRCSRPDDFVGVVENLCIIRAKKAANLFAVCRSAKIQLLLETEETRRRVHVACRNC